MSGMRPHFPLHLAFFFSALLLTGCTSVAVVSNLGVPSCSSSFEAALASILHEQGEAPELAASLAHRTYLSLIDSDYGPRPFLVMSPAPADYYFIVQRKPAQCLLRLYQRTKASVRYKNELTFISTRDLPSCTCRE
jgi:hypothetical protein